MYWILRASFCWILYSQHQRMALIEYFWSYIYFMKSTKTSSSVMFRPFSFTSPKPGVSMMNAFMFSE